MNIEDIPMYSENEDEDPTTSDLDFVTNDDDYDEITETDSDSDECSDDYKKTTQSLTVSKYQINSSDDGSGGENENETKNVIRARKSIKRKIDIVNIKDTGNTPNHKLKQRRITKKATKISANDLFPTDSLIQYVSMIPSTTSFNTDHIDMFRQHLYQTLLADVKSLCQICLLVRKRISLTFDDIKGFISSMKMQKNKRFTSFEWSSEVKQAIMNDQSKGSNTLLHKYVAIYMSECNVEGQSVSRVMKKAYNFFNTVWLKHNMKYILEQLQQKK